MAMVTPAILRWSLLGLLASTTAPAAQACDGLTVYEDRDGNARQDVGEPALEGIQVSDGQRIVTTATDGMASLPESPSRKPLFVIKPPGYRFARGSGPLPGFWRSGDGATTGGCDAIGLVRDTTNPNRQAAGLRVLVMADPQPKSVHDVAYFQRDVVASILEHRDNAVSSPRANNPPGPADAMAADLGLTLGDVVDDDLSLYPAVIEATTSLGAPWLHAAGNHDLDADPASDEASLHTFRRHFGPDTFAWEEPEASFVVLDDVVVRPGESPGYIGGLRPDQFEFLEAYLRSARRDRLLVIAMHIPLFEEGERDTFRDADRERLFGLLGGFDKVLLLTGHKHTQRHVFHGSERGWKGSKPLHEYNVGAASGAFWSGVKDADGIPGTMMADGTPNGYATLHVRPDASYALRWHGARDVDDATGIGLHAPKVLRRGAWPGFAVYANVYMGHEGSRVEYRVGGGEWQPMQHVLQPDPRLVAENMRDDASAQLRGYDRAPEAEHSTHLWRGRLPTDLPVGVHDIEVRAFDEWRGELRASTRYRLVEAAP